MDKNGHGTRIAGIIGGHRQGWGVGCWWVGGIRLAVFAWNSVTPDLETIHFWRKLVSFREFCKWNLQLSRGGKSVPFSVSRAIYETKKEMEIPDELQSLIFPQRKKLRINQKKTCNFFGAISGRNFTYLTYPAWYLPLGTGMVLQNPPPSMYLWQTTDSILGVLRTFLWFLVTWFYNMRKIGLMLG